MESTYQDTKNPSGEVQILYLERLDIFADEKPYEIERGDLAAFGEGALQTNCVFSPQKVTMIDMRDSGHSFCLDKNGFQVIEHKSALSDEDFDDEEVVREIYYKEAEACLKQAIRRPMEAFVLNHQVFPSLR
jgi:hypothetical protein